ncbi:MAG: hypothetical protein EBU49_00225, partial [Proteobacteria bacterium]|nr:hypothetical protein [Pseudomonadota bacterium]
MDDGTFEIRSNGEKDPGALISIIIENQDAFNFAVLTLKREQELLDTALKNEREDDIARRKSETADAKTAEKGSGSGPAPVSKQIVPPNMTMIEKDPERPGVYKRFTYVLNPATGTTERQELGDTIAEPVKATDFYAQPNGDIYSLTAFNPDGSLRKDDTGKPIAPVFKAALKYTQTIIRPVKPGGPNHTFVYDQNSPNDAIDMGETGNGIADEQAKALTEQYKAQALGADATTATTKYNLEQSKKAVEYGEAVYKKDLTAAGALLKLGKVEEAQKAFDAAQKNWEATASARMREKEAALTKGGDAESRQYGKGAALPSDVASANDRALYASIPGREGDNYTQRMARQFGYSDAIDYQRGPSMTWEQFVNNTPHGATGAQLVPPTGPITGPVVQGGVQGPATPAQSSGGKSVALGGGLYWWDDGSGPDSRGGIFHMAPSGAFGADGNRETTMVPTGLYEGKTLEEAKAIAASWFKSGAPPAPAGVLMAAGGTA